MSEETESYGADATFGDQHVRREKQEFTKAIYARLTNTGPTMKYEPGKLMFTSTKEMVDSIPCVLLYNTPCREYEVWSEAAGKKERLCQSHDGKFPSSRVKSPFCQQSDGAAVGRALSKYKGFDAARIDAVVKDVTAGSGADFDGPGRRVLQQCVYEDPETKFPYSVCPMATKDPRGPAPCKPGFHFVLWDLERERAFHLKSFKSQVLSTSKYITPWDKFRAHVSETGRPYFHFQFILQGVKGPRDGFVLDFAVPEYMGGAEKRKLFAQRHEAEKEDYAKSAHYVPQAKERDMSPDEDGDDE